MTVSGPSSDELYELELLNAARLDPLFGAGIYLTSALPLTSSDSQIQADVNFFGVDGMTLYNAIIALTPVQPLAWNDTLATAARTHNDFMISGDTQSHQVTTLGEGNLSVRLGAAGYAFSAAGENVFAYAQSDLETEAAFFIDWGGNASTGGMQSPPGHRNNIMGVGNVSSLFREVGIGITPESNGNTAVGPLVVTEDFGNRTIATPLLFGAVYNDTNGDGLYTPGEGLANLTVSVAGGGNSTSNAAGYWQAAGLVGNNTLTFSGGNLSGNFSVTLNGLTATQNIWMDIKNGDKLMTSGNVTVTGSMANIRGIGALGLTLTSGDATPRDIKGGEGNDIITGNSGDDSLDGHQGNDVLKGGGGNDSIGGGAGIDTAVFTGNRSSYTITYGSTNGVTIAGGGEGTDNLYQVEKAQFADQTVTLGQGPTHTDFNTDNDSDILFQNANNGQAKIWLMNGSTYSSGANLGTAPGTAWHVIGSGDFNADGKSDILWQNSDGSVAIWYMNGTTFTGGGVVGLNPGTSWKAIGVGDFDSDGHADILWQNTNGQVAIWVMNGTTIATGGGAIGSNPGTSWKAIGAGDFDGDGHSDILWQNTNGQVAVWTISNFIGNVTGNLTVTGGGLVGANPGSSWHAKAAGDFNADGQSDILFQNSDGTPAIWLTGGGNGTVGLVAGAVPGFNPGTSWSVIGAGDFNGDGKADILWQNTDGTTAVWLMNGYSLISGAAGPFSPGANWHAIAMST